MLATWALTGHLLQLQAAETLRNNGIQSEQWPRVVTIIGWSSLKARGGRVPWLADAGVMSKKAIGS